MSEEVEAEILEAAEAIRIRIKEPLTFDSEEEEHQATLETLKNVEKAYKGVAQAFNLTSQIEELEEALSDPTYMREYPRGRKEKEAELEELKEQLSGIVSFLQSSTSAQETGSRELAKYVTSIPEYFEWENTKIIKDIPSAAEEARKYPEHIYTMNVPVTKKTTLTLKVDISRLRNNQGKIGIEGNVINYFDVLVYNAVCTLSAKNKAIADTTILKTIQPSKRAYTPEITREKIHASMSKLRDIYVEVDDLLEHVKENKNPYNEGDYRKREGALISFETDKALINGVYAEAYILGNLPFLYRYARDIRQIQAYPMHLLETSRHSDRKSIIRHFLLSRIGTMKREKESKKEPTRKGWNVIRLESVEKALETVSPNGKLSAKQKRMAREDTLSTLDELAEKGYIEKPLNRDKYEAIPDRSGGINLTRVIVNL